MARLSAVGLYCVHSDSYSDDVWVKLPDGSICTMQVKTATPHDTLPSYAFKMRPSVADIYAFVALDLERVFYMSGADVDCTFKRINRDHFTEANELASMLHVLDKSFDITPADADV